MEITINIENSSQYILNANKLVWKLFLKKAILFPLFLLLFGCIMLITGVSSGLDSSTSDSKYDNNTNTVITHTNFYNYHITFGLGIGFIATFFYFLVILYKQKTRFFKAVTKISNRHKKTNNNCFFKITEESLFYKDFELMRDAKWSSFSNYRISHGYLILYQYYLHLNAIPIQINQLSEKEFTILINFIKTKLIESRAFG